MKVKTLKHTWTAVVVVMLISAGQPNLAQTSHFKSTSAGVPRSAPYRPLLKLTLAQDGGWQTYDSPAFSFQYPSSWQVQTSPNEVFATDGVGRGVAVRFYAGAPNVADTFNQCASEDKLLQQIFDTVYKPQGGPPGQYPNTTVTNDGFMPGLLGGRETWVTIVHQEAYKLPITQEHWLNVIPRAGGIYLVYYWHKSEPMAASESFRKTFANSVVLKSGLLNKNAYCNYLGK